MSLPGWSESTFTHDGFTHPVFRKGEGPGVIVIHEIPGITPPVLRFAESVVAAGFTVLLPRLFGEVERPKTTGYMLTEIVKACVSREFSVLAARQSSPITEWLRALARQLHAELGGRGVGAIGMCLTGNFALAMAVDPAMMAPVLSQPSLPFGITPGLACGLHLSDEAAAVVRARAASDGLRILGMRFTGDPAVPAARFRALREMFGEAFEAIEITSPDAAHRIPADAHSVVTEHLVDEEGHPTRVARDRVLAFFGEQLR